MSILKFVPQYTQPLVDMFNYLVNPDKTSTDLIIGLGVNPRCAMEEMNIASLLWEHDENQRSYWQIILSFDANVQSILPITVIKEIATRVGELFCAEHQVLAVIHTDKPNLHCHYLIYSLNIIQGTQFRQQKSLYYYKQAVNQILMQYGLEPIHCYTGQPSC